MGAERVFPDNAHRRATFREQSVHYRLRVKVVTVRPAVAVCEDDGDRMSARQGSPQLRAGRAPPSLTHNSSLDPLGPSEEQIGGNSEILPESFRELLADSTFPADHVRSVAARTEDFEQVPLLHAVLLHQEP